MATAKKKGKRKLAKRATKSKRVGKAKTKKAFKKAQTI